MKIPEFFLSIGLMFLAFNVHAHSSMHQTYPHNGAVLLQQPEKLQLTFDNEVRLVSVKMFDAAATPVELAFTPNVNMKKEYAITLPFLKPGQYSVKWMVMGRDGHKMQGQFAFMQQ